MDNNGAVRPAVTISVGQALSSCLGLIRVVVVAAQCGAGEAVDAYLLASLVPTVAFSIVNGVLNGAVIPTYSSAVREGEPGRGVQFARRLALEYGVYASAFTCLCVLCLPSLESATSFWASDQVRALIHPLLLVLMPTTISFGISLVFSTSAAAVGDFRGVAYGSAVFNIVVIAVLLVLGPSLGVMAWAIGTLLGSVAQCWYSYSVYRHATASVVVSLGKDGIAQAMQEFRGLASPIASATACAQGVTVVIRAAGTNCGSGALAAFNYAELLIQTVISIVPTAIGTVLMAHVGKGMRSARRSTRGAVVAVCCLMGPVAVILIAVPAPLVSVLYARGAFAKPAVEATATALIWLAPSLLARSLATVVTAGFYSKGKTTAPLLGNGAQLAVTGITVWLLTQRWGLAGLAGGGSIGACAQLAVLLALAAREARRRGSSVPSML